LGVHDDDFSANHKAAASWFKWSPQILWTDELNRVIAGAFS